MPVIRWPFVIVRESRLTSASMNSEINSEVSFFFINIQTIMKPTKVTKYHVIIDYGQPKLIIKI